MLATRGVTRLVGVTILMLKGHFNPTCCLTELRPLRVPSLAPCRLHPPTRTRGLHAPQPASGSACGSAHPSDHSFGTEQVWSKACGVCSGPEKSTCSGQRSGDSDMGEVNPEVSRKPWAGLRASVRGQLPSAGVVTEAEIFLTQ